MAAQAEIAQENSRSRIGNVERVLVEDYDKNHSQWVGRSAREAPEVDGVVLLQSARKLHPGQFVTAKIIGADIYDVTARVIRE